MPRRPPSAELNKISVFIVYLHDSVICRQHICLIVNKNHKHVNSWCSFEKKFRIWKKIVKYMRSAKLCTLFSKLQFNRTFR